MNQWDVFLYPFEKEQPHPVVIISNEERCMNKDLLWVNGLLCTTVRLTRPLKNREVMLDESDGLDWATAVRCDFIYSIEKASLKNKRGIVSSPRQKIISRKLVEVFRLKI